MEPRKDVYPSESEQTYDASSVEGSSGTDSSTDSGAGSGTTSGAGLSNGLDSTTPRKSIDQSAYVDAQWSCQVSGLDAEGKKTGPLSDAITVGQKVLLECEGASARLEPKTLQLELPQEQKFSLRLLETRSLDANSASFVATSWVAGGDMKFEKLTLFDGKSRVSLSGVELNVASVIDKEKNPQEQPYPPWGPVAMSWPLWVWLILASVVLAIGLLMTYFVRKRMKRQRLLDLLAKNGSPLTPISQFAKELRKLSRRFPQTIETDWSEADAKSYMEDLNRIFRWYLTREVVIPAIDARPGQILKDLKKANKRIHAAVRKDLREVLTEISRALRSQKKISVADAQQLSELSLALSETITKIQSETRTKRTRGRAI